MSEFLSIYKKELYTFFQGTTAWIVLLSYILLSAFITVFVGSFFSLSNSGLFSYFYYQNIIFLFLIPALTMRLWAEERKSGTIEFLLTQPLSLFSIVMGKFLAAWSLCLIMLCFSFPVLAYVQYNFITDGWNIFWAYLGAILSAGALCAFGCMISSFCNSASGAYLVSFLAMFCLIFCDFSKIYNWIKFDKANNFFINHAAYYDKHYMDIVTGQISLDNIIYFLLIIVLSLVINKISIEYKRN